ncbi:MAG: nucleotide sugar dehydrogenase, partial [Natronomonas sp.]|uniref:nucleotide sugar dehydrogenase n=1 Tax=Natronomonas sp. TaxID=2184060 RepID=UPI0028709307
PVGTTETAELTKTLENTYRMVNIALVNELVTLAEGLDADVWDAIDAAATKPFGFQPFRPGPGVGGHCIPVDPQFLTWRADDLGTEVSFIDDAHRINEQMPQFVVDRFETLLKARGVNIEEASIVALGAAYKPNIGDTRKSPALRVIDGLPTDADVTVVDPHTDPENTARTLVESPESVDIESVDAVILLVDHDAFDLDAIGERASFVFDTRNAMSKAVDATVVKLGSLIEVRTT